MHPALKDMPRLCSFKPTARQLSAKTYVYYKRKSIFPSSSFLHFSKNSSCAPIPNWEFSIQIFISSPNKRKGSQLADSTKHFFLLLYSSSVIYAIWQYRKKQRAYLVAMVLKKSSLSALVFSSEIKKRGAGKPSPAFRTLARAKTQHISPELLLQTPNKTRTHYLLQKGKKQKVDSKKGKGLIKTVSKSHSY